LKKCRKKGSFIKGLFVACWLENVAILTTAGLTLFSIGDSEGSSLSEPSCSGSAAWVKPATNNMDTASMKCLN